MRTYTVILDKVITVESDFKAVAEAFALSKGIEGLNLRTLLHGNRIVSGLEELPALLPDEQVRLLKSIIGTHIAHLLNNRMSADAEVRLAETLGFTDITTQLEFI